MSTHHKCAIGTSISWIRFLCEKIFL